MSNAVMIEELANNIVPEGDCQATSQPRERLQSTLAETTRLEALITNVVSQALPFDDDLAEMHTAGLIAEGVRQLTKGEAAVQDRAYPRLFERSDIIPLVAPAADHKCLQARLLGQQIDGRHFTL